MLFRSDADLEPDLSGGEELVIGEDEFSKLQNLSPKDFKVALNFSINRAAEAGYAAAIGSSYRPQGMTNWVLFMHLRSCPKLTQEHILETLESLMLFFFHFSCYRISSSHLLTQLLVKCKEPDKMQESFGKHCDKFWLSNLSSSPFL